MLVIMLLTSRQNRFLVDYLDPKHDIEEYFLLSLDLTKKQVIRIEHIHSHSLSVLVRSVTEPDFTSVT